MLDKTIDDDSKLSTTLSGTQYTGGAVSLWRHQFADDTEVSELTLHCNPRDVDDYTETFTDPAFAVRIVEARDELGNTVRLRLVFNLETD